MEKAWNVMEIGVNSDVHYVKSDAVKACKYVNCGALGEEVQDHLMGYFARISAHIFGSNAVIRGKYVDTLIVRLGDALATDSNDLRGQIFKASKAAEWLGEGVQMGARPLPPELAGCFDIGGDSINNILA